MVDNPKATVSDESDNIENKTISEGKLPNDFWEPISAFSNADGGTIYLGVEPNGNIVGISPQYHDPLRCDIVSYCKSKFNHNVYPDINIREDNVISIYIPPFPAAMRPLYPKKYGAKGAKVRVGPSNVQVDGEWMRRFAIAARGGAELMTFDVDYKQYFDMAVVNSYLDVVTAKRGEVYEGLSANEILRKLRALNTNDKVTLFGLLAFSNAFGLQELTAPTLNVAVTQYAGTSKINPVDAADVSLDDKEFSGNVATQFSNALIFIKSKLPRRSRIEIGGKRVNYLAIPEIAIREALANAIVHRDYTTFNGKIQIDIYADRIEFINPGRSLVPLNQLESAHSQTRNPLLMSYLRDLNITEHRARGVVTIKNSLRLAGLSEPTFEHRADWFVATLYSSAFIQDDDQIWLQQFKNFKLKEQQLNALVHCKHNPIGINNSEYRKLNNMTEVGDDTRAHRDLGKLVKLKLLNKVGERRYTRYKLASQ